MSRLSHPAELLLHQYLNDAANDKTSISKDTIKQICDDIADAMQKQFGESRSREFRLRMSNIGRPTCQLWFEKNHPEKALPKGNNFVMNMLLGDIVEAVFKGLLKEAGVTYTNSEKVELDCGNDKIAGTYDLVIDGSVDDIKSASDWSYKYKFDSFESLQKGDSFGYIGQLAGYASASGKNAGGWWVVNKANGKFKYVSASNIDITSEVDNIKNTIKTVKDNTFKRCFEPEPETFRGKETGNIVLNKNCTFCDYRHSCWETLEELPSQMSKAKEPKTVQYVKLRKENIL
jgi:hypothetical protein